MTKTLTNLPSPLTGHEAALSLSGSQLLQIAMPLGGIGSGCVCLNG